MDILVLGGTRFVGRHIVEAFLAAGHAVSVFTRGTSPDSDLPGAEHLRGDRNGGDAGHAALRGRTWDACVDVSGYTPRQLHASTALLRGQVAQYVFVSTVSVYAEQGRHPVREDDPLFPPAADDVTEVTGETYGPLKVRCEQIVQEAFGPACVILRPQLVAGPGDYTARYPYWPDRVARGGTVLAAGADADFMQVIDARDLARFAVTAVEERLSGVFNMAGPRVGWREFLAMQGAADVHWTTPEALERAGVEFTELPIYLPANGEQGGIMDVSNDRARAAGLTLTDPLATAQDTRAWSTPRDTVYSFTPEREAEVLALLGAEDARTS
ncbi:NAD-dependent epimerase/dehydratase family protein [Deinococcus ficus]|uniref:NAD-dependent epimerase/dehydratase family protein n=1 Tax=Deinococcus ficus TaxID=317577 RepID=UPI0003B57829|nr:NAD-dependent epimerase/dehydratase family protein [Deinococcus ficus]